MATKSAARKTTTQANNPSQPSKQKTAKAPSNSDTTTFEKELKKNLGTRRAVETRLNQILGGDFLYDASVSEDTKAKVEKLREDVAKLGDTADLPPAIARQLKDARRALNTDAVR